MFGVVTKVQQRVQGVFLGRAGITHPHFCISVALLKQHSLRVTTLLSVMRYTFKQSKYKAHLRHLHLFFGICLPYVTVCNDIYRFVLPSISMFPD